MRPPALIATLLAAVLLAPGTAWSRQADDPLVGAVAQLSRTTPWTVASRTPLTFPTYHPQGFARVGDRLYMSSVEIQEPTVRFPQPIDGYDRTPGKGVGHLFELTLDGKLLRQITLGEGDVYHPGGIDYDGRSLWVPVGEYRPGSASIVYRVNPRTMRAREAFRVDDHIGGLVRDGVTGRLHGVSWGSRDFYTWTRRGRELARTRNPQHYVDFQDCAYARRGKAVCTGVTEYTGPTGAKFELGGIGVVDLASGTLGPEVPFTLFSAVGHVLTRNPVHLEVDGGVLRMYAAPDDAEEPGGTVMTVLEAPLG